MIENITKGSSIEGNKVYIGVSCVWFIFLVLLVIYVGRSCQGVVPKIFQRVYKSIKIWYTGWLSPCLHPSVIHSPYHV